MLAIWYAIGVCLVASATAISSQYCEGILSEGGFYEESWLCIDDTFCCGTCNAMYCCRNASAVCSDCATGTCKHKQGHICSGEKDGNYYSDSFECDKSTADGAYKMCCGSCDNSYCCVDSSLYCADCLAGLCKKPDSGSGSPSYSTPSFVSQWWFWASIVLVIVTFIASIFYTYKRRKQLKNLRLWFVGFVFAVEDAENESHTSNQRSTSTGTSNPVYETPMPEAPPPYSPAKVERSSATGV